LSTTSSTRPRVFIRTPRAIDSLHAMPVARDAKAAPANFPNTATPTIPRA
jgi:hypothetical protein